MDDTKVHLGLTAIMRSLGPTNSKNPQPTRWSKAAVDNLADVEELLDWLENTGYEERRVAIVADKFLVRWR